MSLRCLFFVQGEGRGHMTQALALRRLLVDAGHHVTGAVVGHSKRRSVPAFFRRKLKAPITTVPSPNFVADDADRGVRPVATFVRELLRIPSFLRGLRTVDDVVTRHAPDVIVNFFEPVAGVYTALYRPTAPVVCVGHQYMFHHADYDFPPGRWINRLAAPAFAHLTAWGARRRIALSLYPAPSYPERGLDVLPPLLRSEFFALPTDRHEPFFLVYILNSGYADEVIRWHRAHPTVPLHCFWDRPDAADVERVDDTLTFHQLDDEKFLHRMAHCRGYVCTSGFESVAEAMYLGKPVQVVPVDGHYEQWCNAFDTVRAGAGIRSDTFAIDRLQAFLPDYDHDAAAFRRWLHAARPQYVRIVEAVAGRTPSTTTPMRVVPEV